MCWINLAATRFQNRDEAEVLLDDWEKASELSSWPMRPVLLAYLSGDAKLIRRAKPLSHRLLAMLGPPEEQDLGSFDVLADMVSLSVVAHLDGKDQTSLWKQIAQAKANRDRPSVALHSVASRLALSSLKASTQPETPKPGHIHRDSEWFRLVKAAPTRRLFDLAASPDHSLWHELLQPFVLPLGLLLGQELQAAGDKTAFEDIFARGAYPDRHPEVIYERQRERPDVLSKPDLNSPETVFGFDAVELRGGRALIYHYLGFTWQAPLAFEDGLNAFQFLDHLDLGWRLLESDLTRKQWQDVKKLRDGGRCVHVVAHDEYMTGAAGPAIDRAAKHYGISLEAVDIAAA